MDTEFFWFYRSDKNPDTFTQDVEWTFYEEQNENIEIAYQNYIFYLDSNDKESIKSSSVHQTDSGSMIDFILNVEINNGKERLIGRFSGNVNENKQLKNLLTSNVYTWYFDSSENDASSIWTPFKKEDNNAIEIDFKKFCLSKGSNKFEGKDFTIDFNNYLMENKNNSKTQMTSRMNQCPQNFTKQIKEIKPKKSSSITKITEETIPNIQKDYFLTFKNIFPSPPMIEKKLKFYWNTDTNSIIVHLFSDAIGNPTSDKILKKLSKDNYEEMCELIKTKDKNDFEIKFKMNVPLQMLGHVSKTYWYFRVDETNDEFWEQFSKEENSEIEIIYKQRFLNHQENEIKFGEENGKQINFITNKYKKLENDEKSIMRFNSKYSFPENITRVSVPEEVFKITEFENQIAVKTKKLLLYHNQNGPKTFNELIQEISNELKNESIYLNDPDSFEKYEHYLENINQITFTKTIIKIYTEEGFVYRRVNKVLRDKNYDLFLKFKYYYFSLLYSLDRNLQENSSSIKLYRGLYINNEIEKFYLEDLQENQMILYNEFLSTSSDLNIALKYAKNGLLIEIEVSIESAKRIANISKFSKFEHEKEVLLPSGSILKKIQCNLEEIPKKVIFSLLESNSQAFFNFIKYSGKNIIDFSNVNMDYLTINSLFEGANLSDFIKKMALTLNDSSLLYRLAYLIIESKYLNCVEVNRNQEIKNFKTITFLYNRPLKIQLKNISEEDYITLVNEIFLQNPVFSYFRADQINQISYYLIIHFLKKMNTLTSLELYRIFDNPNIKCSLSFLSKSNYLNDIKHIINFNTQLSIMKLNINDIDELKTIAKSLTNNFTMKKIKIIFNVGFSTKKKFEVERKNNPLKIVLINFDTQKFNHFLSTYLTKENKLSQLKILNLILDTSSINEIIKFLNNNDTLEVLELAKCSIMDFHFIEISKALEKNNSLKRINLYNNLLTNKISHLINGLHSRKIELNLNKNYFNSNHDFKIDKETKFKCTHSLKGHSETIFCLLILKDGKIASGSEDNSIRIWDPKENFQCIKTLYGHNGKVYAIVLLKDEKIVSGSQDKSIKIWDPNNDFLCIKTLWGHSKSIYCLLILKDGKIASGSSDNSIKIWDPNNDFECIQELYKHKNSVNALLLLNDGRIVSGCYDAKIMVWDPNNDFHYKELNRKHNDSVNALLLINDGIFASGSSDTTIIIWDLNNEDYISKLTGHSSAVYCLTLLNENFIASGSFDNTVKIWDIESKILLTSIEGIGGTIYALTKIDELMFVSGSTNKKVQIWNSKYNYKCIQTISSNFRTVYKLLLLSNGRVVAALGDSTIKIWDPNDNFNCLKTLTDHQDSVYSIIQLKNNLLVSGSEDGTIKIWDPEKDYECIHTIILNSSTDCLLEIFDGKIASGGSDQKIRIWDINSNFSCVKILNGHTQGVWFLLKLNNGRFASGSEDKKIKIWDSYEDYNCIKTLDEHNHCIKSLLRISDGKILSGSSDTTIKIWDPENDFKCVKTLVAHTESVDPLLQLDDGMIVSGSCDKTIKIWDANHDYKCIETLKGHLAGLYSLMKLKDGRIVSGDRNSTIKLWEF